MNTRHLLSTYRKKKLEYDALYNQLNYIEPDAEELAVLQRDIKELRDELNTRENIPNKEERRTTRQIRAKKHKGGRRSHKKK